MLFGKSKGSDGQMSAKVTQRYRLWQDKLVQAVRVAMPVDCPYTAVHCQNLVGLFTCVFVKNSEVPNLRDVAITTVKRGMAGMYGNKVGSAWTRPLLHISPPDHVFVLMFREPSSLASSSTTRRSASSTAISPPAKVRSLRATPSVLPRLPSSSSAS